MKKFLVAIALATASLPALAPVASAAPNHREVVRYEQTQRDGRHVTQTRVVERTYNVNGRRYDAQRGPDWRAPRGYQRRHWARNQRLPMEYRRVVVREYGRYHLPRPGRGQEWVRVDNDVVLVSVASGVIGAVIANAFIN